MMKKVEISQKMVERVVYVLIIVGLVVYGLFRTDVAVRLIQAVKEAFSILM